MQIRVDNSLLKSLKENFIFQKRTGMTRGTPEPYVNRWKIGQDLTCSSSVRIEQYATIGEGNILYSIGSFSSSASMLPVGSQVGRYTEISNGLKTLGFRHPIEAVTINSSAFNFSRENVSTYIEKYNSEMGVNINPVPVPTPQPHKKPILIGNDVWIGRDVTIKGGISIGDGAVIASGSMVTKNVPSYTIVGGTPAKFIKKRFSDEIASKLIESQWWNLELGDLYREQLDFSDPARFLAKLSKVKDSISTYTPVSFSPALYKSYGYGVSNEQNKKLVSFHGTPIFYDFSKNALVNKPSAHCSEIELVSTTCGNKAMRISSGNYISLCNEGFVATVDGVHHSAKVVKIKDEDKYFISSPDGQKFLGATKQDFVIKTKLSEWEKFMIL